MFDLNTLGSVKDHPEFADMGNYRPKRSGADNVAAFLDNQIALFNGTTTSGKARFTIKNGKVAFTVRYGNSNIPFPDGETVKVVEDQNEFVVVLTELRDSIKGGYMADAINEKREAFKQNARHLHGKTSSLSMRSPETPSPTLPSEGSYSPNSDSQHS